MDLAFMGIALQLARVKVMLVSDLMPLSLGLEELFSVHDGPPAEPPPLSGEREIPTRWAYTCAAASSHAIPSAYEPRCFVSSIVVAASNTASAC